MNVLYRIKWVIYGLLPGRLTQRAFEECHCWHVKGKGGPWCWICGAAEKGLVSCPLRSA